MRASSAPHSAVPGKESTTMMRRRFPFVIAAVASLALPVAAQVQPGDPSFRINNRGTATIREVYVSALNGNNWGADRLGANVLPPGQSRTIDLPPGQCVYNIRLVFENGQSSERRRIDTCRFADLNVPQ